MSMSATLLSINLDFVLTNIFNGLVNGLILVLIAIGLSIIFGVLGVLNFAHGDLLMVGAYAAWFVWSITGSYAAGIVAALLTVGVLGLAIEVLTLRPIYDKNILLQLLLTFGIAELLRGSIIYIFGTTGKSFPVPGWGRGSFDFVVFTYPIYRLFVIVVALLLVIAVYLFLTRTDFGMIVRAGIENREMVEMLGINISKTFTIVFIIGAAIAGIAGGLIAPIQGVNPTVGINLLIPAFVVVIIGGMASIKGSVVAGLLIGQVIAISNMVYSPASDVIIYVLLAAVLLIRPHGLFGEEGVLDE